jgi:hypothetical protein
MQLLSISFRTAATICSSTCNEVTTVNTVQHILYMQASWNGILCHWASRSKFFKVLQYLHHQGQAVQSNLELRDPEDEETIILQDVRN